MVKILIVDDEPDFLAFLKPCLEEAGLEVFVAECGKDALAIIKAKSPDVLVTDLVMPEMNGIQLIQAATKKHKIPVITISGYPDWGDKLREIENLINVSLLKPIHVEDVVASVDICLNSIDKK